MHRSKGPLLEQLRKSRKPFRHLAIRLLILGEDESSAKPYIVVFCPAGVCDIVTKYFRKDPVRLFANLKNMIRSTLR